MCDTNKQSTGHHEPANRSSRANTRHNSYRVWAGNGQGKPCERCRKPIGTKEIEYEVEWNTRPGMPGLHFHLSCYQEWMIEAQPSLA